jgi:hypothetical protein
MNVRTSNFMTTRKFFYLLLVLLSSISCTNNLETDESILSDILPQMINRSSIGMTNDLIPPPPPPGHYDHKADQQFKEVRSQALKRMDSIDSRLLVGLYDTCFSIDFSYLLTREYPDSLFLRHIAENHRYEEKLNGIWDLALIEFPDDYELILTSDLESKYHDIWSIKDRRFGGVIYVSNVYCDRENKTAILQFDISRGRSDSSASFYVLLEKIDNKWKVKKELLNWIM